MNKKISLRDVFIFPMLLGDGRIRGSLKKESIFMVCGQIDFANNCAKD